MFSQQLPVEPVLSPNLSFCRWDLNVCVRVKFIDVLWHSQQEQELGWDWNCTYLNIYNKFTFLAIWASYKENTSQSIILASFICPQFFCFFLVNIGHLLNISLYILWGIFIIIKLNLHVNFLMLCAITNFHM